MGKRKKNFPKKNTRNRTHKNKKTADTVSIGGEGIFRLDIEEGLPKNVCFPIALRVDKKLRDPLLPRFTEAETPQVTTAKLPYGTRKHPLRAATFLS